MPINNRFKCSTSLAKATLAINSAEGVGEGYTVSTEGEQRAPESKE